MNSRNFLTILWCSLLLATQLPAQPTAPLALPQVLDSIETLMNKQHIPGLMLTMVTRDSVLYDAGLGMADREAARPVDADQLFRLGSISKSFAALCLLRLEAEGRISLQAKLADIAPEVPFTNRWEATDPVRIVHLLEHTAGFDDMHFKAMYNYSGTEPPALDMVTLHRASLTSRWRPGTRMAYSNPDYVIATYLIEKASGMPYRDYVRKVLFTPLGMTGSNFTSFPRDTTRYARGYAFRGGDRYEPVPFYAVYAGMAGALNSSGHDMARFLQLFLNDGRADSTALFTPDQLQRMETPMTSLAARAGLSSGYGLANYSQHLNKGFVFHGHNGGIDGFGSTYAYNRELGVGYAVSNNAGTGMGDIETLLVAFLTQSAAPPPLPDPQPVDAAALADWMGYYNFRSPRNRILFWLENLTGAARLSLRGDTLWFKPLLQPGQAYVHSGGQLFRRPGDRLPTLALTRDGKGRPVVAGSGYFEPGSGPMIWTRLVWFGLSQLLFSTFLLFGFIWLLVQLITRRGGRAVVPALSLFVSVAGFTVMFLGLSLAMQHLPDLGSRNPKTMALYAGSLVFAAGAFVGLVLTLSRWQQLSRLRYYLLLVALAGAGLALFFNAYGWIGLRLWEY